ncbi:MAG: hypothetical protein ACOYZ6_17325 [Chloroflexota bacterium]
MNRLTGKLFYVILSGMILIALIIYSAPAVAASPSPKGTVVPAMPSEEPPPTNTPMPSPTPTGIPSYFSNPGGPSCVGGGCTLPSGYNVVVSAIRNEQSLQAYDPKTGSVFGTGRVETTILVSGAGIGTVSVYYGLSGVSCSGGHSVDIAKRSGNETHLNVPLSGYVDVTLTSLDFGEFTIYTRCRTAGSYVGNFGISSVWYSLIDVATPTPTAAPTSTPTATFIPSPTVTPTYDYSYLGSGYFPINNLNRCHVGSDYAAQTQNASAQWSADTDLNMYYDCTNTQITTIYNDFGDTGWAGYAYICNTSGQCDNSTAVNSTYERCEMRLNAFYISGNPSYPDSEVQKLAMHELGHCFSLGHSTDPTSVMGNGSVPNVQDIDMINARY